MTKIELRAPYLIFLGNAPERATAKTGDGLVQWRRERCAGQLRLSQEAVDLGIPDLTVEQAAAAGVKSLVIGVAPVGGSLSPEWLAPLEEALRVGLDVVNGMHHRLREIPDLVAAAQAGGARLIDLRVPPPNLPVGTGRKRRGRRVLTVGTDCAVGKKYTALALEQALQSRGGAATFRATGQTGIMIAGSGLPIDAVGADFIAGAAEVLSPDNDPEHWDVIEGQGSILHPGYAAVTVGLLMGSQPDAVVVCHDLSRKTLHGWPSYPLPEIERVVQQTIALGRVTNPDIRLAGISVNSSGVPASQRQQLLDDLARQHGVPCEDPLIDGVNQIAAEVLRHA